MKTHANIERAMRTSMTTYMWRHPARLVARFAAYTGLALVGVAATACNLDKTLKVTDVDNTDPGSVINAAGLPTLYAGALSDFAVSVNGTDATVTLPGLLTDELRDIDTFPTRIEVDKRDITTTAADRLQANNSTIQGWYRNMHQARASIKRAIDAFAQFGPSDARNAEMHALLGLMYVYFGEDYCNGVAYSDFVNGVPKFGGPTTTTQSFQLAVAQADSALPTRTRRTPSPSARSGGRMARHPVTLVYAGTRWASGRTAFHPPSIRPSIRTETSPSRWPMASKRSSSSPRTSSRTATRRAGSASSMGSARIPAF